MSLYSKNKFGWRQSDRELCNFRIREGVSIISAYWKRVSVVFLIF